MKQLPVKLGKWVLIILPVAVAVAVAAFLKIHQPGPALRQHPETVHALRVIPAPVVDLAPRAEGYGIAEPVQVWEAVAQVKGRVIATHPDLRPGQFIRKDTLLIHIDPTEYRLAVARLEAAIEQTRANLDELDKEAANTRQLVQIEQQALVLAEKMLARRQQAVARNAVSREEVDREEKNFLDQQQAVQRLQNTLALIPSKRRALNAALEMHQADLEQARMDLEKTRILAPFDCRLSDVNIEPGQFVGTGQGLFKAHGTGATQVNARFRMELLRNLLGDPARERFGPGVDPDTFRHLFDDITAVVTLYDSDWSVQWEARIERVREFVDTRTREIQVMAVVDRPYDSAIPGKRPPLMPGMFCRVTLTAPARPGQVVLPRSALHNSAVYLVGSDDRLEKKPVTVAFFYSDFAVISSGLSGNERVVVSDPLFAIIGMKVKPVMDDALLHHVKRLARAKSTAP
ncbi:MAG TPA: hypothetical protein VK885_13980 [Desulfotignum sp.]|nr:hypothetical protein [Desulfotignum sp.]